jgi:hypothetical protein
VTVDEVFSGSLADVGSLHQPYQIVFARSHGIFLLSAVSIVANTLQQAGLIRYRRGRIEITNLAGLQDACCECYGTVKAHYDRLLKGPV